MASYTTTAHQSHIPPHSLPWASLGPRELALTLHQPPLAQLAAAKAPWQGGAAATAARRVLEALASSNQGDARQQLDRVPVLHAEN